MSKLAFFSTAAPAEMSPAALWQALTRYGVERLRAECVAAGFAPVVATDLDGTLWDGDVGDELFQRGIRERWFLPRAAAALAYLVSRYGEVPRGEVHADAARLRELYDAGELHVRGAARGLDADAVTLDYYGANLFAFAGHSVAEVEAWTRALFESWGLAARLYLGVCQLLEQLRSAGFGIVGVTATCHWMGQAAAPWAGLAAREVVGLRCALEGDRLSDALVPPITYGAGKLDAVRLHAGGPPALALGDSVARTDRALLAGAGLAIAVEPEGPHRVAAATEDGRRFVILRARS